MIDQDMQVGELLLAVGDGDGPQARTILVDALNRPGLEGLSFILRLCDVSIDLMRQIAGDDWRDALNLSLLEISAVGIGEPEVGEDG